MKQLTEAQAAALANHERDNMHSSQSHALLSQQLADKDRY